MLWKNSKLNLNLNNKCSSSTSITVPAWLCNAWSCGSASQSYSARRVFVVKKYIHSKNKKILKWLSVSFRYTRPLFIGWDRVKFFEVALKLHFEPSTHWSPLSPLYGNKSWNGFLKKKNYFLVTKERTTWPSCMTWNLFKILFWK